MTYIGDLIMGSSNCKKVMKNVLFSFVVGLLMSSCDQGKNDQVTRRASFDLPGTQGDPFGKVELMLALSQRESSGNELNLSSDLALADLPVESSSTSADGVAVTIRYIIKTDRQTVDGTLGRDEEGVIEPKKVDLELPVNRAMFQITSIIWDGEEINVADTDQDNPSLGWGCKNNQRNAATRKFRHSRDGSIYSVTPDPKNVFPCPEELNRSANTTVKPAFSVTKASTSQVEQSFDTSVHLKSVSASKSVGSAYPDVSFLRVSACKAKSSSNRFEVLLVFSCKRSCESVRNAKFSKFKQTIQNPQKGVSLSPQWVEEVPKAGASLCSVDDRGEYDEGTPGEELVAYRFSAVSFNEKKLKILGSFEGSSVNPNESQKPRNDIYVELSF